MADTKALFAQRFDAARASLTAGDDPAAAEALHWAIVAARSDPSLRLELASALFHLGKLSRKFGKAGEAEADPLLTEALTISEEIFGREHAALAPLLNELSRLHLKQQHYARAEEILERLLAIARANGEEHPDVAVALSGIAFVKRKIGHDILAEGLYRDALRIREKSLEPNNMLIVATVEQLAETCAALGNFTEALALFHRALPAREAAVGAGHETVRAVRSRISELELQVAIAADTAAQAKAREARGSMPTPAWFKRVPDTPDTPPGAAPPSPSPAKELEFLGEPEPKKVERPAPRPRERSKTPAVAAAAVAAASLLAAPMRTPAASQIAISPAESAHPLGNVPAGDSGALLRDVVLADITHVDFASGDVVLGEEQSALALVPTDSPEPTRKKRTMLYASAGATAAAIALAAVLMLHPKSGSGNTPVSPKKGSVAQPANATVLAPVVTAAGTVGASRADSVRSASTTAAPVTPAGKPEQRAQESAPASPELRLPKVNVQLGPVSIPTIPTANVDSIVRSAAAERQRAADSERTGAAAAAAAQPTASADADDPVVPPKVIGRAPAPRFPASLLRTGRPGEVVVRFKVNEHGTVDVASMIVVQSDHDLFTDAVRDILPLFRFEPARTRASKPVAAWVTAPFLFRAK